MKEIAIFAGTIEGRKLSEYLAFAGICHTICVATEYGEIVLKRHPMAKVHHGRMDQAELREFLIKGKFAAVVDATHPYAEIITRNVKMAAKEIGIPYLRIVRKGDEETDRTHGERDVRMERFETSEDCAKALERTKGNILLTTGCKELPAYCSNEEVRRRLYVRTLPGMESLALCNAQGICGKQVIAMQGPFTVEMNEATIRQYQISCLVTKESGSSGGYQEKLQAAARTNTQVFVIGKPKEEEGYSLLEICRELEKICGSLPPVPDQLEIILAGAGMGNPDCLTVEVQEAVRHADILLGAERIIKQYHVGVEMRPYYQKEQIIPYLRGVQERNLFTENCRVVILFSGDSGFYSGCRLVYDALEKEIQEGRLRASLCIMPGISAVSYIAAHIGESYQDALILSIHGKEVCNLARKLRNSPKTFLLMSDVADINRLGQLLLKNGMASCEVVAGYQLSYTEQKIWKLMPKDCCEWKKKGLYTCFVKNPNAEKQKLVHGRKDSEFVRGKVPMTKEEAREVGICKLQLYEGAVVYDIGSGSGSVSIEIASLSDDIKVYAIEKKKEALLVMEKNIQKFGLENISIIEAKAPEGLESLPVATHTFIGGSGGKLKEILSALYQRNPAMRIVIHAVSLETICELKEILNSYPICNEELVQLQANRLREAGTYHLMQAENPVWILAFDFCRSEK